MTQFTISAAWYPLWAFVVVILVFICLFAANHIPKNPLGLLKKKPEAASPRKNSLKKAATSTQATPNPKASKLAWMKPNQYWWIVVPIFGWGWALFHYRKQKVKTLHTHDSSGDPFRPMAYPGPPMGLDEELRSRKIPLPTPQSHLQGWNNPPTYYLDPSQESRPQPPYQTEFL
jgi:hypothetical protein